MATVFNLINYGSNGLKPKLIITAETGSTVTCDGVVIPEDTILNPLWRNLPSGYTQVEYIKGTGTQYINTGVNSTSAVNRSIIDTAINNSSGWSINGVGSGSYRLGSGLSGSTIYYSSLSGDYTASVSYTTGTRCIFDLYSNSSGSFYTVTKVSDSSKLVDISITNGNNGDGGNAFTLFAYNGASVFAQDLYSCKLYKDTALVRDFIPCLNTTTNKYGLFDIVNNQFYGNSGTGDFTAGDIVPQYISAGTFTTDTTIGTHICTATLGSLTKTETVNVDQVGIYNVSIEYERKLYLYNKGDKCESVTGGYVRQYNKWTSGNQTVWNADSVKVMGSTSTNNGEDGIMTINKIDYSPYTKLVIKVSDIGLPTVYPYQYYASVTWQDTYAFPFNDYMHGFDPGYTKGTDGGYNPTTYDSSLPGWTTDITNTTDEGYLCILGAAGLGYITISEMWLE